MAKACRHLGRFSTTLFKVLLIVLLRVHGSIEMNLTNIEFVCVIDIYTYNMFTFPV
jgi:hypothetical protein